MFVEWFLSRKRGDFGSDFDDFSIKIMSSAASQILKFSIGSYLLKNSRSGMLANHVLAWFLSSF